MAELNNILLNYKQAERDTKWIGFSQEINLDFVYTLSGYKRSLISNHRSIL